MPTPILSYSLRPEFRDACDQIREGLALGTVKDVSDALHKHGIEGRPHREIEAELDFEEHLNRVTGGEARALISRIEARGLPAGDVMRLVYAMDTAVNVGPGQWHRATLERLLHADVEYFAWGQVMRRARCDLETIRLSTSGPGGSASEKLALSAEVARAKARLGVIADYLGVSDTELRTALEDRIVDPTRADELIAQVYGEHLPDGPRDRAERAIKVATTGALAEAWNDRHPESFLKRAWRALHDDDREAPVAVVIDGQVVVGADLDHFGTGIVAELALLRYAHPDLAKEVGPNLAFGIAQILAARLNGELGAEVIQHAYTTTGYGRVDIGFHWPNYVQSGITYDQFIDAFFHDPEGFRIELERRNHYRFLDAKEADAARNNYISQDVLERLLTDPGPA